MSADVPGPGTPADSQPPAAPPAVPAPAAPPAVPPPVPTPGTWGAPPAPASPGSSGAAQPASQWGAPVQATEGWASQPGAPGAPPAGAWNPQPAASTGNGCLKGCLIVGGILLALGIILVIVVSVLGLKFVSDVGINADGSVKACTLISNSDLAAVLGTEAQAIPLSGIADATIGQVLDRRILKDAPGCWAFGAGKGSVTGRLAQQDGGDAPGDFRAAHDAAAAAGYLAATVNGLGDEAFCTSRSQTGSAGVLVRSGSRLVYVSLINPAGLSGTADASRTCDLASQIARHMIP
jgi:hypothetical protein